MRWKVVIAEDHALLVEGFKSVLEPEFNVVGSAKNGVELIAVARDLRPDLVLIDIGLPLLNGVSAGTQLHRLLPTTRLIAVTVYDNIDLVAQAMRQWASGYVLKDSAVTELTTAMREVLKGRQYVSLSLRRRLSEDFARDPRVGRRRTLTPRQIEVVKLLAEGYTMKETAGRLHVTARTIAFHKYQIMAEFGLRNNSELVLFAIRERLIPERASGTSNPLGPAEQAA